MSPKQRSTSYNDESTSAEDPVESPGGIATTTQAQIPNRLSKAFESIEGTTAEEVAGTFISAPSDTEASVADDPAKHAVVSGSGSDTEYTPLESGRVNGDMSGLESVPGYEPRSREAAATDETMLPEASTASADLSDKEFFPLLAKLAPVLVSTVLPIVKRRVLNRSTLKRVGSAIGAVGGIAKQIIGRETEQEAESEEAIEAELEAAAEQLEVIIGTDDRVRIRGTTQVPWRRICQLTINARNGQRFVGTGFLIGKRTVVTAGHCVYLHAAGGWPASIDVAPGRNGGAPPFGTVRATAYRSVVGWVNGKSRDHDYGAIILPTSTPTVVQSLGGFGFGAWPDFQLQNKMVNLSGYPGDGGKLGPDRETGSQWWMARGIKSVAARSFAYDIDTVGGQSGSPVWTLQNGQRIVLGIHTNGFALGNSATRITRPVYDNLLSWRALGN